MSIIEQALCQFLDDYAAVAHRFVVGFSGGRDSTVLLHALKKVLKMRRDSRPILAVHINHQLQPNAIAWETHCQNVAAGLSIPIEVLRVEVVSGIVQKSGTEAAARFSRYEAFKNCLQTGDVLLTAHHEQDNAETVLHRAFKGAGVLGLRAILPWQALKEGVFLARPLLFVDRPSILHYADEHGLHWVEDPTNTVTRFSRNFLRQAILPLLKEHYPGAVKGLSRVARHAAQAQTLLEEIAEQDCLRLERHTLFGGALDVSGLLNLSSARQVNVLRYWIACCQQVTGYPAESEELGGHPPSTKKLEEYIRQLQSASNPSLTWATGCLKVYQKILYWCHSPLDFTPGWETVPPNIQSTSVHYRTPGQRVRLPHRAHTHSLKKLLQELQIPPWWREKVPLIFIDNYLAYVVLPLKAISCYDAFPCRSDMGDV